MFLGTFEPNLMVKARIALPKKIRHELGNERLILTIGFEICILGFKEKDWITILNTELNRPLFSDKTGRDLRRKMCSEAVNIDLDTQGRFVIPEAMVKYSDIKNNVVIIGAGDHFEIWNKDNWEKYRLNIE